VKFTSPQD